MPRKERGERLTRAWVQGRLMINGTQRYIDMVTTDPPPLYDTQVGGNVTFLQPTTVLAIHAVVAATVDIGAKGQETPHGFFAVGVPHNAGDTMIAEPGRWPLVFPLITQAVQGTSSSLIILTGTGGTRSMRKAFRGDVLNWDWYGHPTAPWTPSRGTPAVAGIARFLLGW